jgi:type II secretory pathway pseudopilin PulG
MTLTRGDLRKLQFPLIGMLILLIVAGLLAWSSLLAAQKAEQERQNTETRKVQIEQRLRQARTEEQELKDRALTFQRMQDAGIAGEEKRLDWTEMLRDIQHNLRLPGMNYEFGVQAPLESAEKTGYNYFASPMRLQLRLLHEADLLNFLNHVQQNASALVLVRNCKLTALPAGSELRTPLPQLSAECELQWVTTHPSTGEK